MGEGRHEPGKHKAGKFKIPRVEHKPTGKVYGKKKGIIAKLLERGKKK